ncbi:hypothetical protein IW249_001153 [Micromonospora vinacea]|uniref:Uncharacterized protein n=1 Tax=Micromonospora vinacea TaxID=709878 RepID=A0ABS0JWJ7_9ACTN|nr:hypothetical protein [Micromonospora vinacea]
MSIRLRQATEGNEIGAVDYESGFLSDLIDCGTDEASSWLGGPCRYLPQTRITTSLEQDMLGRVEENDLRSGHEQQSRPDQLSELPGVGTDITHPMIKPGAWRCRASARPPTLRPTARGCLALAECRRPADEVARRMGHGVAGQFRVYANCIDGGDDTMPDKIGHALT